MARKITTRHYNIVKLVLNRFGGSMNAEEYGEMFMVSRPTAIKRMKQLGEKEDFEVTSPKPGQRRQTVLRLKRFGGF